MHKEIKKRKGMKKKESNEMKNIVNEDVSQSIAIEILLGDNTIFAQWNLTCKLTYLLLSCCFSGRE